MVSTKLEIAGISIALGKDIPVPITFVLADVREPDKRNASRSNTISIPGTSEINKIFENIFQVNIATQYFNKNLKTPVKYFVNETINFEGDLQLRQININPDKSINYECTILGEGGSLFIDIGDALLSDLDFSAYNHDYTRAEQIASRSNYGTGLGVLYPFIHRGSNNGSDSVFNVKDFLPCFHKYEYVKKIIEATGRTFTSTILSSAEFKKQITYPNISEIPLSQTQLDNRQFYAGITADVALSLNAFTLDGNAWKSSGVLLDINQNRETAPYFDTNNINSGTFATINDSGNYNIAATERAKIYFDHTDAAVTKAHFIINGKSQIIKSSDAGASYVLIADNSFNYDYLTSFINEGIGNAVFFNSAAASGDIFLNDGDLIKHRYVITNITATYYDSLNNIVTTGTPTFSVNLMSGDTNATSFYTLASAKTVSEGNALEVNNALPVKIKQRDYLKSIIQAYNLYIDIDRNDPNNLIIEDYNAFYSGDVIDFETRTDLDKQQTVNPNLLEGKRYIYTYKSDADYYNIKYQEKWREVFGTEIIEIESDFKKDDKINEIIFSPTPNVANYELGIIHPKIYQLENNIIKPLTPNIRWLICGGVKQSITPYTYKQNGLADLVTYDYLYAGHVDDPLNPTVDLNFGILKETFYTFINTYFTNNNLYNRFQKNALENITNRDSKFITKYLWMTPLDIKFFSFRNRFFIDGAYYIFNKIVNYNGQDEDSVLCELIKLLSVEAFSPSSFLLSDTPTISTGSEVYQEKTNSGLSVGSNIINKGTNSIAIGDNISIPESASNVTVIGNNVVVGENVTNLSLINVNNLTVDSTWSGATITNVSSFIGVEDNTTIAPGILMYIIDTANAGFDITLTFPSTLPEGVEFWFKRSDNSLPGAYKIFFYFPSETVDITSPAGTYELLPNAHDAISLVKFNSNWNIK